MSSKLFAVIILLLCTNYNLINAEDSVDLTLDLTCSDDNDCSTYFRTERISSRCFSHQCRCFDERNTTVTCKPKKNQLNYIGDECPCSVENSICHPRNNTCMCNNEYKSSVDGRSCIPTERNLIGNPCPCDIENSMCHPQNNTCVCNNEYISSVDRRTCIPLERNLIGDSCPCAIPNSSCDTRNNTCVCTNEYTSSEDRLSCVPVVRSNTVSGECDNDSYCKERDEKSYCDVGKKMCACPTNFTMSGNRCVPFVDPNSLCTSNEECRQLRNNTECLSSIKKCVCIFNYYRFEATAECLPFSTYGRDCSSSHNCRMVASNGVCVNGKCQCAPNYYHIHVKERGYQCIKKIFVGDDCDSKRDCFEANRRQQVMDCVNGECACLPKYIKTNGSQCVSSVAKIFGTNLTHLIIILSNLIFIYGISIFSNN